MKLDPTAWLRAMARRQRPTYATGGIITGPAPILNDGCVYPISRPPSQLPDGVTVTFHPESTPPLDLAQKMADALNATAPSREHTAELTQRANERARQARIDLAGCTCAYIYSRCYPQFHDKPTRAVALLAKDGK